MLEKKHTNYIPLCEGIVSMQMIDAIIRSSHTGKKVRWRRKMDKKGLIGVQMMMLKEKVAEVGIYEVF